MLTIENLTVEYERGEEAITDFSMQVQPGEIVSLVGESGSGKTTVVRAVMGLLPNGGKITGGKIVFDGTMLTGQSQKQQRSCRGRDIAMIFQDSGVMLNPIRKIGTQFVEYIKTHEKIGKAEAAEKAAAMLEKMRLPDCADIMKSYPFQLSGGMCQRVGIAMAMALKPKLLLADEPTSALDVTTQAQVVRQMLELKAEYQTAIVIVTHNLGVAAYMSDHIIVMKDGKTAEQGSREEVLEHAGHAYTKSLIAAVPALKGERYV